jgi:hypothetical protein
MLRPPALWDRSRRCGKKLFGRVEYKYGHRVHIVATGLAGRFSAASTSNGCTSKFFTSRLPFALRSVRSKQSSTDI